MVQRVLSLAAGMAAVAMLAGCVYVPQEVPSADQQAAMRGKTYSVAVHDKVDAKIQTMGKTGLFGALADPYFLSEGARVIREDGVGDPAALANTQIESGLGKGYDMRKVGKGEAYTGPGFATPVKVNEADLLAFYPEGDYVLDVDSNFWWVMYNLTDGYHVLYTGYARLIDRATGKPVAARVCGYDSNSGEDDHPDYDEMLANHSAKLKAYLAKAGEQCATAFMANVNGVKAEEKKDEVVAAKE